MKNTNLEDYKDYFYQYNMYVAFPVHVWFSQVLYSCDSHKPNRKQATNGFSRVLY